MKIATLSARIGGALIDLIIVLLISGVICFVWGFLIGIDDGELNLTKQQSESLWRARGTLVGLFVDCVYSVLMMTGSEQATYGQKAVGIKIIKDNGTKIGFGTAIGRWVGSIFSSILLKIGFLIAMFTTNKKTLHDLMAGTIVIENEQSNQKNEKLVESNSQAVSIKNKNVEVGKNKVIDSMEDAYIRATEFKSESKKTLIDKNNSINVPKNKRIESMEDAYSQIAQDKVSIEKIHESNKVHSKNIEEEKIWELVAEEFDSDYRKKGLYARLFVEMNGDEKKIQVMYYKIRVEELINEIPFAEKLETNNIEKEKINYELASDEDCINNGWYKKEWIKEFTCLLLHNGKAVVDRAEIQIIYKDIEAVKNAIAGYGVTGKFGDYKKIKEINKS
jgi:uncharacterized RDD family membrane protein YckC